MGLRAHKELSDISHYIVRNSYRAAESDQKALKHVGEAQARLKKWREDLPDMLKLPEGLLSRVGLDDPLSRPPGLDRANCSLHMAYNQVWALFYFLRPGGDCMVCVAYGE